MHRFLFAIAFALLPLLAQQQPQEQPSVPQATDKLDRGELKAAQAELESLEKSLAKRVDADGLVWLNVTRYRLAEVLGKQADQKAAKTKNDVEAVRMLEKVARKFAEVANGPDCSTPREGGSLHAAALQQRILIEVRFWAAYKELAKLEPQVATWRTKRDAVVRPAHLRLHLHELACQELRQQLAVAARGGQPFASVTPPAHCCGSTAAACAASGTSAPRVTRTAADAALPTALPADTQRRSEQARERFAAARARKATP